MLLLERVSPMLQYLEAGYDGDIVSVSGRIDYKGF